MPDSIIPSVRWGILGTGWISTNFVTDLLQTRPDPLASHSITAVGSSSVSKGSAFVDSVWSGTKSSSPRPKVFPDYSSVYNSPDVDIVYIGTPHALHKQNCLDAIAAGKHVLCEKPFTINESETQEVISAAREKGVFVMEAVWTRFFPVVKHLQKILHQDKILGSINRMFCDFGIDLNIASLPATSRLKDPALGAGALLDVGIYCLTLASLVLGDGKVGDQAPAPEVTSHLTIVDGVDYSNVVIFHYPDTQRTGILTSSVLNTSSNDFCRIEGSLGAITMFGLGASVPDGLKIQLTGKEEEVIRFDMPKGTMGFFYEADAVALDISSGKRENADVMPLAETRRMMKLMDGIRKAGGLRYPQDEA